MKLDRNLADRPDDKYQLRNMRTGEIVEDDAPGEEHEFFVIMLKDRNAFAALVAYAGMARFTDPEFAGEVMELASRAGKNSPFCKDPD